MTVAVIEAAAPDLPAQVAELRTSLDRALNNNELLEEAVADLERSLFEPGWIRLSAQLEQEFSPEGMRQMRAVCRLFALKNPLIRRGLGIRSSYVWGQGVEITARANGKRDGEQDVQAAIDAFLNDPGNQRSLTGAAARDQLETTGLGCDGEVYVALFTRPTTGSVQARILPADEIAEIICNPDDASEPWFYLRRWTQTSRDLATGGVTQTPQARLYPAVDHRPMSRPKRIGQWDIDWWAPVLHVPANQPLGWQHGVPDAYAAVDWAKAYKEFLEDWARLMRALSRYAWKATAPGKRNAAVRQALGGVPPVDPDTGVRGPNAGNLAVLPPDVQLEAVSKTGATIDAGSGRPIATMIAAALEVPVTMLTGDPGIVGARATAETLDQPTERAMGQRRELWAAAYQRILRYVIVEAVRAPQGPLKGVIRRDRYNDRELLELAGDTDATVDVTWPRIEDLEPGAVIDAVVAAAGTGVIPPEQVARLLLTALGVRNVDELVAAMVTDDGRFIWPQVPPMSRASPGRSMIPDTPDDDSDADSDDEPEEPDDGEGPDA